MKSPTGSFETFQDAINFLETCLICGTWAETELRHRGGCPDRDPDFGHDFQPRDWNAVLWLRAVQEEGYDYFRGREAERISRGRPML